MKHFSVLCLLFVLLGKSSATRQHLRVVGQDLWKYVLGENSMTFDGTISWCNSMGGELPYIHTQEDMDFFLNQATDASYWTWIGLKRANGSCLRYLDGSLVDYNFKYSTGRTCSVCTSDNCALLITSSNDQRQAYFTDTSNSYRSVCIIKVRNFERTLQNMNTSMIHFEEEQAWQSHVIVFMIIFSVFILLTVIILAIVLLKKQSVKVTHNMRYQTGAETISSSEPPVYETASPSINKF